MYSLVCLEQHNKILAVYHFDYIFLSSSSHFVVMFFFLSWKPQVPLNPKGRFDCVPPNRENNEHARCCKITRSSHADTCSPITAIMTFGLVVSVP